MADPKDTRSFFRKVVNFVVNPATDWGEGGRPSEARESEFAKSELKAMIERKRRNDFVRKRELDMLRKLRRQGLTPEQLAALGSSSGMADTEGKLGDTELPPASGMKAKIDEIEQQMAGNAIPLGSRRPHPADRPAAASARTAPAALPQSPPARLPPTLTAAVSDEADSDARSMADTIIDGARLDESHPGLDFAPTAPPNARAGADAPTPVAGKSAAIGRSSPPVDSQSPSAMEVSEAVHDPELDEAVISYANGDNDHAERLLIALIRHGGARSHHSDTWMVVFDLYRATGQQARFEPLALEYAERFGRSAPHWFSVPRLIAEAATQAHQAARPRPARIDGQVGWVAPERLDAAAVGQLRARSLSLPLPWVFDWTPLKQIDPDAAEALLALFRHWTPQNLDMRWIAGDPLLALVADAAPIGVRDVDPVLWQLRLQVLRMSNRPDKFDEVAIDYCVTYEVSPPSWEPAACRVRLSGPSGAPTNVAPTTIVGDASTSFVESQLVDEPGLVQLAHLELAGQLVNDIGDVLRQLDAQLGAARLIEVSCVKLLRVDFMASGDLLNWVLARNREERVVSFVDTNRLVALFFMAIGIDSHATIKVRSV